MLRLHTFGACFLARDGVRLDALSGQRKGLALLALLAVAGERGVSREALLAHLWPESDEERARTSLKQLVHSLRQQLQTPELVLGAADLRLSPAHLTSDVAEFRDALQRGDHERAVELYAGPFLDGFYLRSTDGFERWAAAERAVLAADFARALEALAEAAGARGDARAAVDWWRRLANAEPISARGAVGLMGALDAAGERAGALRHARVYEQLVRDELGSAPDPSVAELVARLQRAPAVAAPTPVERTPSIDDSPPRDPTVALDASDAPAVPAGAVAAPPAEAPRPRRRRALAAAGGVLLLAALVGYAAWNGRDGARNDTSESVAGARSAGARSAAAALHTDVRPSVAVLPFANTSGDPADEHFSDGLTDELIGALGKVTGLRVAARTSAFALKGRPLDARAAARTLGVGAVLEGSVRRAGDRLKVGAQLVSAADGSVLWTETYDRGPGDVFAVQEEIARAIAAALRVRLGAAGEGEHLVARPTADLVAYELYLKGRYVFRTRTTGEGIVQAAGYFERAVARDPTYARAFAGLSDTYTRQAIFGYAPPRETFAKAKAAAERALALDSTLAEAHVSLGHVLCVAEYAWEEGERELRRAITLDPSYAFARGPLAICVASQGRVDEAIALLETARGLDPLSPPVNNLLGRAYVSAGRPDDAIRVLSQMLELDPQLDLAHQQLGHAYLQKGMAAEAIAAFRRAAALSGPRDSAQLAYAYAVTGQRAEAERILATLLAPSRRDRGALPYHLAMAYAGLGDADAAFWWLERGYAERASFMVGVKAEEGFARLHADPRWARLLRRMELAP